MLKKLTDGILAGILIAIGGTVFLACDVKYVGAFLFSIALLCICFKGYSLYTGKICYMAANHSKEAVSVLLWGLLGNFIATLICGALISYTFPAVAETARTICTAKLTQSFAASLIRGIFCGILIFLAVDIFRNNKSISGILIGIPVFILSGYEHSIADMFYFAAAGFFNFKSLIFILIIILGNSIGGLLFPVLSSIGGTQDAK